MAKNVRYRCSSCAERTGWRKASRNGYTCKFCGAPLRAQAQELSRKTARQSPDLSDREAG